MSVIKERRVSWQPSTSEDVVLYRVRWSPAPGQAPTYSDPYVEVPAATTKLLIPAELPGFPLDEATRQLGISAVDAVGNESDIALSPSVPFDFAAPNAPSAVIID